MNNQVVAPIGYNQKLKENKIECIVCGKEFRRRGERKFTAKFCSIKCKGKWQKGKPKTYKVIKKGKNKLCVWCSNPFYTYPSYPNKKFCSPKCYHEAPRELSKGSKHWNWKGGITPENQALRKSHKYSNWRTQVFKRDKYTCKECGQLGGKLEADHIKAWSDYPEERFKIKNGRTLCKKCHEKTPNYKRKNGKNN